jgi:hypothetical protein
MSFPTGTAFGQMMQLLIDSQLEDSQSQGQGDAAAKETAEKLLKIRAKKVDKTLENMQKQIAEVRDLAKEVEQRIPHTSLKVINNKLYVRESENGRWFVADITLNEAAAPPLSAKEKILESILGTQFGSGL